MAVEGNEARALWNRPSAPQRRVSQSSHGRGRQITPLPRGEPGATTTTDGRYYPPPSPGTDVNSAGFTQREWDGLPAEERQTMIDAGVDSPLAPADSEEDKEAPGGVPEAVTVLADSPQADTEGLPKAPLDDAEMEHECAVCFQDKGEPVEFCGMCDEYLHYTCQNLWHKRAVRAAQKLLRIGPWKDEEQEERVETEIPMAGPQLQGPFQRKVIPLQRRVPEPTGMRPLTRGRSGKARWVPVQEERVAFNVKSAVDAVKRLIQKQHGQVDVIIPSKNSVTIQAFGKWGNATVARWLIQPSKGGATIKQFIWEG